MEREKYVDESWKESVEQEKEKIDNLTRQSQSNRNVNQAPGKPEQSQEPIPLSQAAQTKEQTSAPAPQTDEGFLNYLSSLAYQSMIFLGEIPHPMTNMVEKNLPQAKFLIDTLVMLREKTKGNLSKQESDLLNSSIYELQMRFVEISEKEPAQ